MTKNRFGLAIVGTGNMAGRYVPFLRAAGEEIEIFCKSRDLARAEGLARKHDLEGVLNDFKDDRIDAVLLCTPHDAHLEGIQEAASAKKHILCEKPIARTLEDADAAIEAARKNDVILSVTENYRYLPAIDRVIEMIQRGEIGRLKSVVVNSYRYRGERKDRTWRQDHERMGGGALIDGGVHYVSLLLQLGGPLESVYARTTPKTLELLEGEDTVHLIGPLQNGGTGILNFSWGTIGVPPDHQILVAGTEGTILVNRKEIRFERKDGTGESVATFDDLNDPEGFRRSVAGFIEACRGGPAPRVTGEVAREDLAVVLAAYRSIETGQPESVSL